MRGTNGRSFFASQATPEQRFEADLRKLDELNARLTTRDKRIRDALRRTLKRLTQSETRA